MIILALDTCETYCSAALVKDGSLLASYSEDIGRGHAETLLPAIEKILEQARLGWNDIEKIAVITGPGTFTGLRIGLSVARGLAISLKIPCVGVSALECLANQVEGNGNIHACIKGRGNTSYHQKFFRSSEGNAPKPLSKAASLTHDEISTQLTHDNSGYIIGSGAETFNTPDILDSYSFISTPCDMLALAALAVDLAPDTHAADPHYLRAPDAAKAKSVFPFANQISND